MTDAVQFLSAAGIGFLVSAIATRWLATTKSKWSIVDHPNERSLHASPVRRGGGLAVVLAFLLLAVPGIVLAVLPEYFIVIATAAGVLAAASYVDDRRSLSVSVRMAIHLAAAAALLAAGYSLSGQFWPGTEWHPSPVPRAVITLLYVVWMINLYNFMDGMDGFAGGMAVFGFGGFALLGIQAGNASFVYASATVAAAAAGFLVFNFPPARIFLGDVGSVTLGFLAAAFSLWGAREGVVPIWTSVLLFSPFVVDATFTLLRRALAGERIWQAHRTHIYQRLVQCGWGHRRTVLWEYALMLCCLATALWTARRSASVQGIAVAAWIAAYVAMIAGVGIYEKRIRMRKATAGAPEGNGRAPF